MSNEQIVKQIQAGIDVKENQERLWKNNRKFVLSIIMRYCGFTEELDDLEQQGFLGLLTASAKYRPEQGTKFITYSAYWIKQSIFRYNENCAGSIRVPAYMKSNIRKYEQFRYVYRNEHGRYPSEAELCQELKLSPYSLMRLEETIHSMRAVRLDEPAYGVDADECFLAFLQSDEDLEETVTYSVYRAELHSELEKALKILDPVTRNMIYSVYYQGYSKARTAELFRCSKQNVCERIGKGFYRILHSPHREILEGFLGDGCRYNEYAYSEYADLDVEVDNKFLV